LALRWKMLSGSQCLLIAWIRRYFSGRVHHQIHVAAKTRRVRPQRVVKAANSCPLGLIDVAPVRRGGHVDPPAAFPASAKGGGPIRRPAVGTSRREDGGVRYRGRHERNLIRKDFDRLVGQLVEVQGLFIGENARRGVFVEELLQQHVWERGDHFPPRWRRKLTHRRDRRRRDRPLAPSPLLSAVPDGPRGVVRLITGTDELCPGVLKRNLDGEIQILHISPVQLQEVPAGLLPRRGTHKGPSSHGGRWSQFLPLVLAVAGAVHGSSGQGCFG
jgi:hypothetical protein